MIIHKLENDHLLAEFADDASAIILDKATGYRWQMLGITWQDVGPMANEVVWPRGERYWADYFTARFRVAVEGESLRVRLYGPPFREDDLRGTFRIRWSLDGRSLGLTIEDIDERLPGLNFPPPVVSQSLIFPHGVGEWKRKGGDGMMAYFRSMNQRWFGGLASDNRTGWMALIEEGHCDSASYCTSFSIMPAWLKSHGRWNPRRAVRYHFVSGGYVAMCKIMRRFMRDRKLVRTLDEKIAANPKVRNLVGGRFVSAFQCSTDHPENAEIFLVPRGEGAEKLVVKVSHADAAEAFRLAKSWGMSKGMFVLRGTWKGGYDERHPDIWPPEPALGSIDELKKLFAHNGGSYLTALHDNYQDIYPRSPSFPQGVLQTSDGRLLHGGIWHGGQTYIVCPTWQRIYAERNWPQIASLGVEAHFLDTVATGVQPCECYDPTHPTTRAEEQAGKLKLMSFFKDKGIVLGSEEASDFAMWHIDWLENRHTHKPGLTPPLWPLVFHDAAVYARYSSDGTAGGTPADELPNWLWGYASYWPINSLSDWRTREKAFRDSLALDAFHARVATSEMTDHRYYGEDMLVERSEFSCGTAVYANFADEPRTVDNVTVPAKGKVVVE